MENCSNKPQQDIIDVCQKLYEKNMLAAEDGNVSLKLNEETLLITPSGLAKKDLQVTDICSMDFKGQAVEGEPSSEKWMHLLFYEENKEAQAVIHAHPPYAVSLSLARPQWKSLPPVLSEVILALGEVPFVPYVCPGTKEMAEVLRPFVRDKDSCAFILSHHGAITWGKDLKSAYFAMERLEHAAQMIYFAETLGGSHFLKDEERKELLKKRERNQ